LVLQKTISELPMKSSTARTTEIREVMDIRQASDYLGISPDTLYKYASESFIPAFKLGNRWRFKKSRLDEWMDRQSGVSALPEPAPVPAPKPVRGSQKKPVRGTRANTRRLGASKAS
jgi:excisionase family DNA binding protein